MDKKTIITIILATLLALISACFILKKDTKEPSDLETQNIQQQEEIVSEEKANLIEDAKNEEIIDDSKDEKTLKPLSSYSNKPAKNVQETPAKPVFEQIVVQEGSVVEEVEKDYGIRKIGENSFEITREFNFKSPNKYSFKGYGVLDETSSK